MITVQQLKAVLEYNEATGEFRWKEIGNNNSYAGKIAGCLEKKNGYIAIRINYRKYRAHILAWLYMTGEWPDHEVDHKNRIRHDNKWLNLRKADSSEQRINSKLRIDNTSGTRGVTKRAGTNKWTAQIWKNRRKYSLGDFDSIDEAAAAYKTAAEKLHGDYRPINL